MNTAVLLVAYQTTFFITIDSLLFSLASSTRSADLHGWSVRAQVINASLGGAIIFHVCACEFPFYQNACVPQYGLCMRLFCCYMRYPYDVFPSLRCTLRAYIDDCPSYMRAMHDNTRLAVQHCPDGIA